MLLANIKPYTLTLALLRFLICYRYKTKTLILAVVANYIMVNKHHSTHSLFDKKGSILLTLFLPVQSELDIQAYECITVWPHSCIYMYYLSHGTIP